MRLLLLRAENVVDQVLVVVESDSDESDEVNEIILDAANYMEGVDDADDIEIAGEIDLSGDVVGVSFGNELAPGRFYVG